MKVYLISAYKQYLEYWSDGRPKSNTWTFSDNSIVPMTENVFWEANEPDNNNNDKCARLQKEGGYYLWDDQQCDEALRYICEY